MRIACLGGGPAGLYFAISMKLRSPGAEVTIFERNKSDDTFGWGVVLSDQTLENLRGNDPISADMIQSHFAYWDDLSVIIGGAHEKSTGHGFCGIGRMRLLLILQERARQLGVTLKFATEVACVDDLKGDYDVVVACDGLNSKTRERYQEAFRPVVNTRANKFVWLGTHQKFNDAFTFIFEKTDNGSLWAHAYQFDADTATFIVETDEATWKNYGFGKMSQQESIAVCEEIFKDHLGGQSLMTNANHVRGSAWINFPRVLCEKWHHENIVLLGDAAATAHFSIGSGTKLAMESAMALADLLHNEPTIDAAFIKYETDRRAQVLRIQSAALNSLEWFENIHRYLDFHPVQFNYSQVTRSQRISHENLRLRDPKWLEGAERWFQGHDGPVRSPIFAGLKLRDMELENRVVVAPMSQYRAMDGAITDWHLVHYGERAKGGAGLIVTEALAVTPNGRATLGDAGLYDDKQIEGWYRIASFVHAEGGAKICAQLGHAGPRAATKQPWNGDNLPLTDGWPLIAASDIPWGEASALPKMATMADLSEVTAAFVAAANRAKAAGFDMLELHAAAGGLLGSFLSPVTNKRGDSFGGSVDNRLRFPLEVVGAVRSAWPSGKPLSLRFCAHDWLEGGLTAADAVAYAKAFAAAGVDIQVITTGETRATSSPQFGRMYQTPFSDQIRNEAKVSTMAVGNIYEADHANSILMAGRADLVAVGRPHLTDPYWTNREAAKIGDIQQAWPAPYALGAQQLNTLMARDRQI
ncbi:bifunctional salicylyl-CoA 5-hydroxylase/oxidoreductase [Phyllobacterium phragmitis]|uniref:Bifunctional salicylyl-CoA 5-hydroxylase/oxidoreductase n=1 Tax=Phyllobacterium phragmitis TaxID=2670329 RepID=A0A2S9IT18_9HYPH|nr:bifunctional salicylyl-CoA 5-hydroxylase/oxidoreductase [Phyllobacterium phragmitis]PRD43669.1 bifunctional salicylyl-CoA 5-hydroxylase/oxidoreductase [Phyllobacterium phragmitis]